MEHEKCYVFKPDDSRPSKRRRLDHPAIDPAREDVYRQLWAAQHQHIRSVLKSSNGETIDQLLEFVNHPGRLQVSQIIPTGYVLAGPDATYHRNFFEQLAGRVDGDTSSCFALLEASDASNLKALLKNLIRKGSGDREDLVSRNGIRLMDYDLQLLYDWMHENERDQLVIGIQDAEEFDGGLLADLIELLRYVWYLSKD
jgi:origin recognition complex subunit 3